MFRRVVSAFARPRFAAAAFNTATSCLKSGVFSKTAAGVALATGTFAAVSFQSAPTLFAAEKVDYAAVRKAIEEVMDDDNYEFRSWGPVFVRLAWHSAGTYDAATKTGGSNGGTIRFAPECNHGANAGLGLARNRLESIKERFPGITYADLYTLAGAVAIEAMGGPAIPWAPGRTDATDGKACPPDGRLPDASQKQDHVRAIFYRMGFNDREIVALVGAHALGKCHTDRSGYDGPWTRAPTTFSNEYFRVLLEEQWTPRPWKGPMQYENKAKDLMMLPADKALIEDPAFRAHVERYARDENVFFQDFAAAYGKLLALGAPAAGSGSASGSKQQLDKGRAAAIGLLALAGAGFFANNKK